MYSQLVVLLAVLLAAALGIGDFERGNRLYRAGEYEAAVEAYRTALADGDASPALHYNLGTALLQLGRYDEAGRHFDAALRTVEPGLRQRVLYNMGNRYLLAARSDEHAETAPRLLADAVEAYKRALRLSPDDADAKWNLELALRERERQQPPPQTGSGRPDGRPPRDDAPRDPTARRPGDGRTGGAQPPADGDARDRRRATAPRPGGMTREEAARILSAIGENERELYREQLRKGRRETPVARDW